MDYKKTNQAKEQSSMEIRKMRDGLLGALPRTPARATRPLQSSGGQEERDSVPLTLAKGLAPLQSLVFGCIESSQKVTFLLWTKW